MRGATELMLSERRVATPDGALNVASGPENGPPLLFLHGVGRLWQDFLPLVPRFACRWQFFAIDFRGHGQSDRAAGKYLVTDYLRDALYVAREVIGKPLVVYGHSLGALVTAAAVAELGELARGAVLEDPPFDVLGRNIADTPFHSLFVAMRSLSGPDWDVPTLARELANKRIGPPDKPQVRLGDIREATAIRFGAACLRQVDPTVWDPLTGGRWLDGYDKQAVLGRIGCPVLLLQGDVAGGGMLADHVAADAAARIADCTHVRVAGGGHLIHSLRTEATLRLVGDWLESVALDPASQLDAPRPK
jgi:pimeloyl-ACP methyl ester carboxylesterase